MGLFLGTPKENLLQFCYRETVLFSSVETMTSFISVGFVCLFVVGVVICFGLNFWFCFACLGLFVGWVCFVLFCFEFFVWLFWFGLVFFWLASF